jgi:protein-tyrosine phosphatase
LITRPFKRVQHRASSTNPTFGMKKVLFLCTGNYYRSRFAEELFNEVARQRGLPWRAESRGLELSESNVGPISSHTIGALARAGIAPASWRTPHAVAREDFQAADVVIAVKELEHRQMLARGFPDYLSRVEFWHVHDLDCAHPDETIAELARLVHALIQRLATGSVGTGGETGPSPEGAQ